MQYIYIPVELGSYIFIKKYVYLSMYFTYVVIITYDIPERAEKYITPITLIVVGCPLTDKGTYLRLPYNSRVLTM